KQGGGQDGACSLPPSAFRFLLSAFAFCFPPSTFRFPISASLLPPSIFRSAFRLSVFHLPLPPAFHFSLPSPAMHRPPSARPWPPPPLAAEGWGAGPPKRQPPTTQQPARRRPFAAASNPNRPAAGGRI